MAEIAQNDTWPPIRGGASDEDGIMDLTDADWCKFIMKGPVTVSGTAEVLDPVEQDAEGNQFNWKYTWAAADTGTVGDYDVELEVHWDDAATPPQIQTVPGGESDLPVITIRDDLA